MLGKLASLFFAKVTIFQARFFTKPSEMSYDSFIEKLEIIKKHGEPACRRAAPEGELLPPIPRPSGERSAPSPPLFTPNFLFLFSRPSPSITFYRTPFFNSFPGRNLTTAAAGMTIGCLVLG